MKTFNLEAVPSPIGKYVSAQDYYAATAEIKELKDQLRVIRALICDGASVGFNCHAGEWADQLFASNQETSRLLK